MLNSRHVRLILPGLIAAARPGEIGEESNREDGRIVSKPVYFSIARLPGLGMRSM